MRNTTHIFYSGRPTCGSQAHVLVRAHAGLLLVWVGCWWVGSGLGGGWVGGGCAMTRNDVATCALVVVLCVFTASAERLGVLLLRKHIEILLNLSADDTNTIHT